jgi:hypothetical protein
MENKHNFKKLLCYNIVNNCKCVYKNKCMFAHTLDEQKKEPIRQYIYNMLYVWDDLSNININEDKLLLDELNIFSKECKNCINKKCPGGYNCRFGVCLRENKICYNDMIYGKCYNMLMETNHDGIILYRCIHGIHLTEKKLIPYNQRMLSELTNLETNFLIKHNVNFNSKNNIISILLNSNTISLIKDIISNKISKTDIINNLKMSNNLIKNNLFSSGSNIDNNKDDDIFEDLLNENLSNENLSNENLSNENLSNENLSNENLSNENLSNENDININNKKKLYKNINFENKNIINNIVIYDDIFEKNFKETYTNIKANIRVNIDKSKDIDTIEKEFVNN